MIQQLGEISLKLLYFMHSYSFICIIIWLSVRMEIEADQIGVLLMAAAGYDPRVAPKMYEKLGQINDESSLKDYLSTHPSGKTRAKLLAQSKVMEKALDIYIGKDYWVMVLKDSYKFSFPSVVVYLTPI